MPRISGKNRTPFFIVQAEICRKYIEILKNLGKQPCRFEALEKMAIIHRINALAALKSADHGWLGASFSAMDLLTVIYHCFIPDPTLQVNKRNSLILSKGHAVVSQYAILAALGVFPAENLLTYKAWKGLPAHCDRMTPGIDADSGSLGHGLSKGIGLALTYRKFRIPHQSFVVLGDGELQEGQLFESFLTLRKYNLNNCIPIIDRNYLQSDSSTKDIKDAKNWKMVLEGIGLKAIEIDGHRPKEIFSGISLAIRGTTPTVIIAETRKGYGSTMTEMSPLTKRREGVWHGKIPDDERYLCILNELVQKLNDSDLSHGHNLFRSNFFHSRKAVEGTKSPGISTGDGFGRALVKLAGQFPDFLVLDADLEKSCRLTNFAKAYPRRFLEIGISEQDMVSVAAGLGLGRKIGIVNTYSSFYKRCYDQVFGAAAEKAPVIFAGHYAGLDYFSDGKTHQSIQDIGFMRSLELLDLFEPLTPDETEKIMEHLLTRMTYEIRRGLPSRPAYIRLHRTPTEPEIVLPKDFVPGTPYFFLNPLKQSPAEMSLFAASPSMLETALNLQTRFSKRGSSMDVIGVSSYFDHNGELTRRLEKSVRCISIESHQKTGGLGDFLATLTNKPIFRLGAKGVAGSARSLPEMLSGQGLSTPALEKAIIQIKGDSD